VDENGNRLIETNNDTAFIALKDRIFVYTDTANLFLKKKFSQDVKNIYNELESEKSDLLNYEKIGRIVLIVKIQIF